jgi:hypothetical protein
MTLLVCSDYGPFVPIVSAAGSITLSLIHLFAVAAYNDTTAGKNRWETDTPDSHQLLFGINRIGTLVTIFNEQRSPREFNDLFTLQSRTINTLGA